MQKLNLRLSPAWNGLSLPCVIALLVDSRHPSCMNAQSIVAVRRGCIASPWKLAAIASRAALHHPANALPAPCADALLVDSQCPSSRECPVHHRSSPLPPCITVVTRRRCLTQKARCNMACAGPSKSSCRSQLAVLPVPADRLSEPSK